MSRMTLGIALMALLQACGSPPGEQAESRTHEARRETAAPVVEPPPPPPAPPPPPMLERRVEGPRPVPMARETVPPPFAVMRVFYATDRNRTTATDPGAIFDSERGALSYGTCEVSIPRDHRMGELEAPSIWKLEFRENPNRHVVLLRVEVRAKDEFFAELGRKVRDSEASQLLVFVHGYNVTFEDAARRTAQMSYDLGFDGAPVFYSWPSQGSTPQYTVDEQNIEWAEADMKAFLVDVFSRSEAEHVYLIAHSMGNRALTRAAAAVLAENPSFRPRLKEVILAAPDIDAEVFKRDIAPALASSGRPITLYASSGDLALDASRRVHGHPRAGDSHHGVVIVRGVETIDASGVDTSLLGHSYFAEAGSVVSDLFRLISTGRRASERPGLVPIDTPAGRYWKFGH